MSPLRRHVTAALPLLIFLEFTDHVTYTAACEADLLMKKRHISVLKQRRNDTVDQELKAERD